jgi:hypothetical protein
MGIERKCFALPCSPHPAQRARFVGKSLQFGMHLVISDGTGDVSNGNKVVSSLDTNDLEAG